MNHSQSHNWMNILMGSRFKMNIVQSNLVNPTGGLYCSGGEQEPQAVFTWALTRSTLPDCMGISPSRRCSTNVGHDVRPVSKFGQGRFQQVVSGTIQCFHVTRVAWLSHFVLYVISFHVMLTLAVFDN